MRKLDALKSRLLQLFDRACDCLQEEVRESFSIVDFKGQSYILLENNPDCCIKTLNGNTQTITVFEEQQFNISGNQQMVFIPIDGKEGLLGYGDSYCDFVCFDHSDFCFVEFKLNATSLSPRAIRKNRKKAIQQLANTLMFFDERLVQNYEDLTLEAYVCTPLVYPRQNAAWNALAIAFLEEYGIEIYEQSEKICR